MFLSCYRQVGSLNGAAGRIQTSGLVFKRTLPKRCLPLAFHLQSSQKSLNYVVSAAQRGECQRESEHDHQLWSAGFGRLGCPARFETRLSVWIPRTGILSNGEAEALTSFAWDAAGGQKSDRLFLGPMAGAEQQGVLGVGDSTSQSPLQLGLPLVEVFLRFNFRFRLVAMIFVLRSHRFDSPSFAFLAMLQAEKAVWQPARRNAHKPGCVPRRSCAGWKCFDLSAALML